MAYKHEPLKDKVHGNQATTLPAGLPLPLDPARKRNTDCVHPALAMSNYDGIKAECTATGKMYEDSDFPAEYKSIYYMEGEIPEADIQWKRPGAICTDPQFVVEGFTRTDVCQGKLGDCWFLAAAANLTLHGNLFDHVVPKNQDFTQGVVRFNVWQFGQWVEVCVDDRLPTYKGMLMFSKSESSNEFWCALLEKAYAKLHGSYQAIIIGYPHNALVDFTGGIGEYLEINTDTDMSSRFQLISQLIMRKSILCTLTKKEGGGIVKAHAYSIIRVMEVEVNGTKTQLVLLRNPWGCTEWTGAWSDKSEEWQKLSDAQMNKVQLVYRNDGEFWMSLDDFKTYFYCLCICHLTPDNVGGLQEKLPWHIKSFNGEWQKDVSAGGYYDKGWTNPQFFVTLTDADEGDNDKQCTIFVALMQKFTRLARTLERTQDYCEVPLGVHIYKVEQPEVERLDNDVSSRCVYSTSNFSADREITVRLKLDPGKYCIIPSTLNANEGMKFLLRIMTENPATNTM